MGLVLVSCKTFKLEFCTSVQLHEKHFVCKKKILFHKHSCRKCKCIVPLKIVEHLLWQEVETLIKLKYHYGHT